MSFVEVADARDWLAARTRQADLVMTDPPHLDNFEDIEAHRDFVNQWVPLALEALKLDGILYHSCGASPRELENYMVYVPDQILVWPHEPNYVATNKKGFAPGHHFHLVYYRHHTSDLRWSASTFIPLEKPYPLWQQVMTALVDESALVFDPFCGRGEIPSAAKLVSRAYRGCDINPESIAFCRSIGL